MKFMTCACVVGLSMLGGTFVWAAPPKPAATSMPKQEKTVSVLVTDRKGVETTVNDADTFNDVDGALGGLTLKTKPDPKSSDTLNYFIPWGTLISLKIEKGKGITAVYRWADKELTVAESELAYERLQGKSSFGDFKISTSDIASLEVVAAPAHQPPKVDYTTKLTIVGGIILKVGKLERENGEFRRIPGYAQPVFIRWNTEDIAFKRGGAESRLTLDKIKSLERLPKEGFQLTVKDGTKTDIEMSNLNFCAVSDRGYIRFSSSIIQSLTMD